LHTGILQPITGWFPPPQSNQKKALPWNYPFQQHRRDLPSISGRNMYKTMAGKERNNLIQKYIDDILIIFDQNKRDGKTFLNHMNNIDKHLEFKL
jgi:dihydrofolate reductase